MTPSGQHHGPPAEQPIGLQLNVVARQASRAFDEALAAAGGTRPIWLVLLALVRRAAASQQQLADEIGIRGATLTQHLTAMESRGLVTRARETGDRRIQVVQLTAEGKQLFHQLRATAQEFDTQLRAGITEEQISTFNEVLNRIAVNLAEPGDGAAGAREHRVGRTPKGRSNSLRSP